MELKKGEGKYRVQDIPGVSGSNKMGREVCWKRLPSVTINEREKMSVFI